MYLVLSVSNVIVNFEELYVKLKNVVFDYIASFT
jgi:hypothetical protein